MVHRTKPYNGRDIANTIRCYYQVGSLRAASRITGVSKSSVSRWVTRFGDMIRVPETCPKKRRKRTRKSDSVIPLAIDKIRQAISQRCTHTLGSLVTLLHDHGVFLSRSTVCRLLQRIGITRKRRSRKWAVAVTSEKIQAFQQHARSINLSDVLCIDETHFDNTLRPLYGWSFRGAPLPKTIQHRSFRQVRCTCIMALSMNGIEQCQVQASAVNRRSFLEFVMSLRGLPYRVILMDNLIVHKAPEVMDEIARQGKTALFIPPYSPEYNPIEQVFAIIKSRFRRTVDIASEEAPIDIARAIHDVLCSIHEKDDFHFASFFKELQDLILEKSPEVSAHET